MRGGCGDNAVPVAFTGVPSAAAAAAAARSRASLASRVAAWTESPNRKRWGT